MLSMALLLVALAQEGGSVEFRVMHKATQNEPIDFVRIVDEAPLRLEVYSERRRLATWTPAGGSQVSEGDAIAPHERFLLGPTAHLLGIGSRTYTCMVNSTLAGLVELSRLQFLEDFPRTDLPDVPDQPGPQPPQAAGACSVRFSADGSVVVFATTDLERGQPSRITVFRGAPQAPAEYVRSTTFVNRTQGQVSISDTGQLIARADGDEVVVFRPDASPEEAVAGVTRRSLKRSFALAPDGKLLACWSASGAVLTRLSADGEALGQDLDFPTSSACLDVRIEGDLALVRERAKVQLIRLAPAGEPFAVQQVLLTRSLPSGQYTSMGLLVTTQRTLVALGSRGNVRLPMRGGESSVAGSAQATAEVVEVQEDAGQVRGTLHVPLTDWTYDTPTVQLVPGPPRLVVTTPHNAQVSEPIP